MRAPHAEGIRVRRTAAARRSAVGAALLASIAGPAAAVASKPAAKATSGTAWVSVTHAEGRDLYVAGDFKDKVLGRGTIVYVVRASPSDQPSTVSLKARVTISTTRGSFVGKGSGTQTVSPDGQTVTVTDGRFDLGRGTGAYRGRTFKGTFGGTFADGVYTYAYKATYR
jgi:hypothetical protein